MLIPLFAFLFIFGVEGGRESVPVFFSSNYYQAQPDTGSIKRLLDVANDDINRSNYLEARGKINQAKQWADQLNFSEGKELAALRLGEVYLNIQFFDSARVVLEKAIEQYPDTKYEIQMLNLLATAYRYNNNLGKAIELYENVLNLAEEQGKTRVIAGIHQNMAVAYIGMGKKVEGLNSYLFSIDYAEQAKDTAFLVIAYNNLGDTYNSFGDYEQSEFYLQKSFDLAKQNNLRSDLLRATTNLANLKSNQGDFDQALSLYQQALDLLEEVRPNTPPFQILYNLGNLELKKNNPDKAISYFQESLKYCLELNVPPGVYYNYAGLGFAAEQKGNLRESIRWQDKALEIAENLGTISFIQETKLKLYELNKEAGNFEKALTLLETYKILSDSLLDLEQERNFAELENQIELNRQTEINTLLAEKQEQQEKRLQFQLGLIFATTFILILLLYILYTINRASREKTKAYNQLSKQREELEKLNQEMNKLFAIISHDLRAPLASMHGVLFLLKTGDLPKEEITKYTDELEVSVKKNIDVMEDLLSWAKKQMSGITLVKEELNLHEVIESVIAKQESRSSHKEVSISNTIDKNLMLKTDVNVLKLIFRNLLSNSIKFTNSGDTISFTSEEKGNTVELCVSDTGVGMSEEVQRKVFENQSISFSLDGTKGEKGTGFGLSLIKEFVDKLGGEITIESEQGKGTKFCIKLPKG